MVARLVYLGTPELAVAPLRALVAAGHDIELVVSRADRRRGRGTALSPSPVKAAALELGLAVTDRLDAIDRLWSSSVWSSPTAGSSPPTCSSSCPW